MTASWASMGHRHSRHEMAVRGKINFLAQRTVGEHRRDGEARSSDNGLQFNSVGITETLWCRSSAGHKSAASRTATS